MRVWLLAALPSLASALLSVGATDAQAILTPITRVVQLLQGLSDKIEVESKQEEDLYETYMCWGKSVVSQKEASNAAANARIGELSTYISDLENGRIELTTERVDLEKEIASLTSDIEQATALREKETQDFEAAKTEMEQAVDALGKALTVLREGTGSLISMKSSINGATVSETYAALRQENELLQKAVDIGSQVLTKGDAVFLRRVLTADVPTKDWKKLNRKATFKQKYKARSVKIEALLQKLLEDFSADLQEAEGKEAAAVSLHDKLMTNKGGQKDEASLALSTLDKENGARSLSKTDAIAERDALTTQVTDDTRYITETGDAMATKKTEWTKRKGLRQGEVAAISEAIGVLHSDDARDLMKKSYASQGYLFFQEASAVVASGQRAHNAVAVLQRLSQRTHDRRLAGLALLASTSHFAEVISAIDGMLTELRDEDTTELGKKETCETDRGTDTRAAITEARAIDELSDTITGLVSKIEEIEEQIKEKNDAIVKIDEQLAEAKKIRERENEDYLVAKGDDEAAVVLVGQASKVLTDFYATMGLLQRKAKKSGEPGQAPAAPPPTWTEDYGGKTAENNGIVAILGMIKDDIQADLASAKTSEDDAVTAYDTLKSGLETEKSDLNTEISTLGDTKAGHEGDLSTNKGDRRDKKTSLDTTMEKIKNAAKFCDWLLINYGVRAANRNTEIDGLEKAKQILQGADFEGDAPESAMIAQRSSLLKRVASHK